MDCGTINNELFRNDRRQSIPEYYRPEARLLSETDLSHWTLTAPRGNTFSHLRPSPVGSLDDEPEFMNSSMKIQRTVQRTLSDPRGLMKLFSIIRKMIELDLDPGASFKVPYKATPRRPEMRGRRLFSTTHEAIVETPATAGCVKNVYRESRPSVSGFFLNITSCL